MTPWQSLIASKAMGKRLGDEARQGMAHAWHTAAFTRAKKLPHLSRVIGDTERKPKSADDIVKALQMKFGEVKSDG
ncbi:MAG: hypothetical protein JJE42_12755 [Burkholderiales bacterium]|nr:hypothetical protein [Burkholderiales bacterium]